MNGYVCFYGSKRVEIYANSQYGAKKELIAQLQIPKSKQHMISVILAEKDGNQVIHVATD